ncbi:hypothetical protein NDU88_011173, partial [Pleurodeles waltl]
PRIPLWRLHPGTLDDPEYDLDMSESLLGYFDTNWNTACMRGAEWGALKVVVRGASLSKTYGIRKKLEEELGMAEGQLSAMQSKVTGNEGGNETLA